MKHFLLLLILLAWSPTLFADTHVYNYPAAYVWSDDNAPTEFFNRAVSSCSMAPSQNERRTNLSQEKGWRMIVPAEVTAPLVSNVGQIYLTLGDLETFIATQTDSPGSATARSEATLVVAVHQGNVDNAQVVHLDTFPSSCVLVDQNYNGPSNMQNQACSIPGRVIEIPVSHITNPALPLYVDIYITASNRAWCRVFPTAAFADGSERSSAMVDMFYDTQQATELFVEYEETHSVCNSALFPYYCERLCGDDPRSLVNRYAGGSVCNLGPSHLPLYLLTCEREYFATRPDYDLVDYFYDHRDECGWLSPCDIPAWESVGHTNGGTCEIDCEQGACDEEEPVEDPCDVIRQNFADGLATQEEFCTCSNDPDICQADHCENIAARYGNGEVSMDDYCACTGDPAVCCGNIDERYANAEVSVDDYCACTNDPQECEVDHCVEPVDVPMHTASEVHAYRDLVSPYCDCSIGDDEPDYVNRRIECVDHYLSLHPLPECQAMLPRNTSESEVADYCACREQWAFESYEACQYDYCTSYVEHDGTELNYVENFCACNIGATAAELEVCVEDEMARRANLGPTDPNDPFYDGP